jgi:hypothetical protein
MCIENGVKKAYGAGLLSSYGELEYACAPYRPAGGENTYPEYLPWEPAKVGVYESHEHTKLTGNPAYFLPRRRRYSSILSPSTNPCTTLRTAYMLQRWRCASFANR